MSKINTWGKKVPAMILAVVTAITMLPLTAAPVLAAPASVSALPVAGDILEVEGGSLQDGVLVFDLGDYDEVLDSIDAGNRIPITIKRPKGADAGYQISAQYENWGGSDENGFQIFDAAKGTEPSEELVFAPGETEKTIYIGDPYNLVDNTRSSGTLTSYIHFEGFNKTDMPIPMLCLQTTKTATATLTSLPTVAAVQISEAAADTVRQRESKVIVVDFLRTGNQFEPNNAAYCKVTGDLTLTLSNGAKTLKLKPVEKTGSILSSVTFVLPADAIGDGEGWEVESISGIVNAKDDSKVTWGDETLIGGSDEFSYAPEPEFDAITTDKAVYKGNETVNVSIPVEIADIGYEDELSYWTSKYGLSYDGGMSFLDAGAFSWDDSTQSIEASFTAPENKTPVVMRVAVEVYEHSIETQALGIKNAPSGRAIYGVYKIIEISPEPTPVPPSPPAGIGGDTVPKELFTEDHIRYIRGYGDNTIRPEKSITRAEVAIAFYRLLDTESRGIDPGTRLAGGDAAYPWFTDVNADSWYGLAIDVLAFYGVLKGDPDGRFRPDDTITRSELAAVVSRFESLEEDGENPYSDVDENHWAYQHIISVTEKGWFIGSGGLFRPNEHLLRAEFVTVVNRVFNRHIKLEDIPADSVHKFDDLEDSHWSYPAFIEAIYTHDFVRQEDGVYEKWTDITGDGLADPYNH